MNDFWSTRDGKTVRLAADNVQNWIQTKSKVLFVPTCYDEMWTICQQVVNQNCSIVVSGTPGVGKSCFLDFALHNLLAEGKSVLYLQGKDGKAYVYTTTTAAGNWVVQEHTVADARDNDMAKSVDFVLIDPPEGGDPNFFSDGNVMGKSYILAVSPDRNDCQSLRKGGNFIQLFMGTRSIEELQEMRMACYPTVTEQVVVSRFEEFGGVPRFVFEKVVSIAGIPDVALEPTRDAQRTALQDVVVNPRRVDSGDIASAFKSLWTIYHMKPITREDGTTNYVKFTIDPCCDDVRTRIRDELMKKSVSDLWTIYVDTREELGTLRGIRFEAYAHKKILTEGLRHLAIGLTQSGLSSAAPRVVTLPPLSSKITLLNNDVGLQNAVTAARNVTTTSYLLPHSSNFPVVDSIVIPGGRGEAILLQMKAGNSRPLSRDNANAIVTATGSKNLFFVVPDLVTMTRKLPGADLTQYRIVLNESRSLGLSSPLCR